MGTPSSEPSSGAVAAPGAPAGEASGRAWFVLAILLTVFVFSHVDRQILNILLESIRKDLEFSDTVMGLLTGPAFVLFYTVAGVPFARISDRHSRRMIITFGLAAWSIFTAAQGFAKTLAQFATARVLVGVGEATMSPASHSIIADYFPPHRRSLALGIFALGFASRPAFRFIASCRSATAMSEVVRIAMPLSSSRTS